MTAQGSGTLSNNITPTNIDMDGGTLNLINSERLGFVNVESDAIVNTSGSVVSDTVDNYGEINSSETFTATNLTNYLGGVFNAMANLVVTNTLNNNVGAAMNQYADLNVGILNQNGQLNLIAEDAEDTTRNVTVTTLNGTGTISLTTQVDDEIPITANLNLTQTGTSTFDGIIEGDGQVTKSGAGTLRLSNNQTFTGDLDIAAGILQTYAPGVVFGSVGGAFNDVLDVSVSGTAQFIAGNTDTINSLTIGDTATLALNADLTTTEDFENNGTTNVNSLRTFTAGGGLKGDGDIAISLTNQLTMNQAGDTEYAGTVKGFGSFNKTGEGTLSLTGVADSIDLDAGLNVNEGVLELASDYVLEVNQNVAVGNGGQLDISNTQDFAVLVNTLGGETNINAETQVDNIVNMGTISNTADVTATDDIQNYADSVWNQSADITTLDMIQNGTLNVYADDPEATTKIINAATFTGIGTVNVNTLNTLDGDITSTLNLNLSSVSRFDGVIAGDGQVIKSGNGTLRLSNNHTFKGDLEIAAGTLQTYDAGFISGTPGGAFDDSINVNVTGTAHFIAGNNDTINSLTIGDTALLSLNADLTTTEDFENNGLTNVISDRLFTAGGGLKGNGDVQITADNTLTLNQSGNTEYAGTILGDGAFVKSGEGSLSLTGIEDSILLGDGLIINDGILELASDNSLQSTQNVLVNNGGQFDISNIQNFTLLQNEAGAVTNIDAVTQVSNIINRGEITNTANVTATDDLQNQINSTWNQYADITTVDMLQDGTLYVYAEDPQDVIRNINTATFTGAGTVNLETTSTQVGDVTAILRLNQSSVSRFDGVIAGDGSFIKDGAGMLQITNTHTFTGGMTVADGSFMTLAADQGLLGSTGGMLADSLDIIVTGDAIFQAGMDDTVGSFDIDPLATLELSANLTTQRDLNNNGTTILNGDRVFSAGGGLTGSGLVDLNDSDLAFEQEGDTTYSGSMSGDGSFTKTGEGALTLNGDADSINVTQGLFVSDGYVLVDSENTLAETQDVTVTNGGIFGVLQAQRFNNLLNEFGGAVGVNAGLNVADLTNQGNLIALLGSITAGSLTNAQEASFESAVDVNVTNTLLNEAGADFAIAADVTALNVVNHGDWTVSGGTDEEATRTMNVSSFSGSGAYMLEPASVDHATSTLDINLAGTSLFDGVISGDASVTKSGAGALYLSNGQTFAGNFFIESGTIATLAENQGMSLPGGLFADTTGIEIQNQARFIAGHNDSIRGVTVNEGGVFELNADINTSDNLVNNGTIEVDSNQTFTTDGGLQGSGNIALADDGVLTLDQSANTTYSGTVTGSGGFTKNGPGVLSLNGAADSMAIDGMLTINQGVLSLDGANILQSDQDVRVNTQGELELLNGDQSIMQLSGEGIIDLGSNTLLVNNGGGFDGQVIGTGVLDILNGSFNINNEITSTTGVFNVNSGATTTVTSSSTLSFPTINVQNGGTLNIEGAATATEDLVVATGANLHLGTTTTTGSITTPTTSVRGTLSGSGSVSGGTTVNTGGILSPGNSPGTLTFQDVTLASGSIVQMEIIQPGVAGTDFDQIIATGDFVINPNSRLDIIKFGSGAVELAQGDEVQIFDFNPGALTGSFDTITSTYDNDVIFNLATGTVLGLGGVDLDSFMTGITQNSNQQAMLASLEKTSGTNVAQFYGGNLLPALVNGYGNASEIERAFALSSPEAYASLIDQTRLTLANNLRDTLDSASETRGLSIHVTHSENSTDNGNEYASYDMQANQTKLKYTMPFNNTVASIAVADENNKSDSRFMAVDGRGYSWDLSVAHKLPVEGLSAIGFVSWTNQKSNVTRDTLNSKSSTADIKTKGNIMGLGVGYQQEHEKYNVKGSVMAMHYKSEVDSFEERNADSLEALAVQGQEAKGAAYLAKAGVEKQVTDKLLLGSELSYLYMTDADDYEITARGTIEEDSFTVKNLGVGKGLLGLNLSADYKVKENWNVSASTQFMGDNSINNNYQATIAVDYKF